MIAQDKPIGEYIAEAQRLRQRIEHLEHLVDVEHDLKEHYKHAYIEGISKSIQWSVTWKRACKYWRSAAKHEQELVNRLTNGTIE